MCLHLFILWSPAPGTGLCSPRKRDRLGLVKRSCDLFRRQIRLTLNGGSLKEQNVLLKTEERIRKG